MSPGDEAIATAIQNAREHHDAGRLAQAEELYWQILQSAPDHPDALHLLGMLAFQRGHVGNAVELVNKAIRQRPSDPDIHLDLGDVFQHQGKHEEAIACYSKALSLQPDYPLAHFNMGNAQLAVGRPDEAAESYRKAILLKPDYVEALNNLGSVLQRLGKPDEAVLTFRTALSFRPRSSGLHFNLGNALRDQGKLDEAIACYREAASLDPDGAAARYNLARVLHFQGKLADAIAIYRGIVRVKPNHAEACYHLGAALHHQGMRDEAVAWYRKALTARPAYPEAHNDLGTALKDIGRLNEAADCYRIALLSRPDFAEAHNNLGNVLQSQGKPDEAVACYDRALSYRPGYAEGHNNRGNALCELGHFNAAAASYMMALDLKELPEFRANFAQCVGAMQFREADPDVRRLVTRAVSEPWARPADLANACASLIKLDRSIGECVERASHAWPTRLSSAALYGPAGLAALAGDLLLRALLESTPVCDIALERLLTMVRQVMLNSAVDSAADVEPDEATLAFYCAVARQCFVNEYVFAHADDEFERLASLRERLVAALGSGERVPAMSVVAAAAYVPLSSLDAAQALRERSWPAALMALVVQQVVEPLAERVFRDAMPRLTPMGDDVSRLVVQQYEENPYPRWIKAAPVRAAISIDAHLRQQFPFAPFDPLGKGNEVDILIAGCGSGQEPIETARRFPGARVLAIDLSVASLAYAKRKTDAIGIDSVRYAKADITLAASIGRTFDVIEAVGVLHRLADPVAGWRDLCALLRPRGVMLVGLYSDSARQDVVAGRRFVASRGYTAVAADIRRCRQDLMGMRDDVQLARLTSLRDFYSTSECRDLLFHVEEHRFTLPQVRDALDRLGLRFVGFELPPQVFGAYRQRFPDDAAGTNLDRWEQFEAAFPAAFIGMYKFWVQKAG